MTSQRYACWLRRTQLLKAALAMRLRVVTTLTEAASAAQREEAEFQLAQSRFAVGLVRYELSIRNVLQASEADDSAAATEAVDAAEGSVGMSMSSSASGALPKTAEMHMSAAQLLEEGFRGMALRLGLRGGSATGSSSSSSSGSGADDASAGAAASAASASMACDGASGGSGAAASLAPVSLSRSGSGGSTGGEPRETFHGGDPRLVTAAYLASSMEHKAGNRASADAWVARSAAVQAEVVATRAAQRSAAAAELQKSVLRAAGRSEGELKSRLVADTETLQMIFAIIQMGRGVAEVLGDPTLALLPPSSSGSPAFVLPPSPATKMAITRRLHAREAPKAAQAAEVAAKAAVAAAGGMTPTAATSAAAGTTATRPAAAAAGATGGCPCARCELVRLSGGKLTKAAVDQLDDATVKDRVTALRLRQAMAEATPGSRGAAAGSTTASPSRAAAAGDSSSAGSSASSAAMMEEIEEIERLLGLLASRDAAGGPGSGSGGRPAAGGAGVTVPAGGAGTLASAAAAGMGGGDGTAARSNAVEAALYLHRV